jgi:chitin synthase
MKPLGQVYYTWDDLKNSSRNLVVYDSIVLDLNLLNWLDRSQVSYPDVFDDLKQSNNQFSGQDITMQLLPAGGQQLGGCLTDIIQVGYIDTNTFGCVASTVVLYAPLVVIIGLY